MSAFDRGIIEGITGAGTLVFRERLIEVAPCCRAHFYYDGNVHESNERGNDR